MKVCRKSKTTDGTLQLDLLKDILFLRYFYNNYMTSSLTLQNPPLKMNHLK